MDIATLSFVIIYNSLPMHENREVSYITTQAKSYWLTLQVIQYHILIERRERWCKLRYQATLEEVSFDASRGVSKTQILSLATGSYIRGGESILITGATGCGKSFIATSFGYQACKQGFSVNYFSMQKLMAKIKIARIEGVMMRFFEKLAKTDLLILDDFGIGSMDNQQQQDFMEIIEDRHARKATIIASQLPPANWFELFTDETIADAFMDRIIHTSHRIELKGESLRKKR